MINRLFGWLNFNDRLALYLLILIPGLWILDARGWVTLNEAVNGALITTWSGLILYYWRKQPPSEPPSP